MSGPLAGCRVLVTRPRDQAPSLEASLTSMGADVVVVPLVEIQPLSSADLSRVLRRDSPRPDAVVFTSANAVRVFRSLAAETWIWDMVAGAGIFVVGPRTAAAVREVGLEPESIPVEYTGAALADQMLERLPEGARVLIPRAETAGEDLPSRLAERGAQVYSVPIYRSVLPAGARGDLEAAWAARPVDVITFASGSAVRGFLDALGSQVALERAMGARVACLGPITAEVARGVGLRVDIIPAQYTSEALADAIAAAVGGGKT